MVCGMSREDALLALERHATSKIAETADLDRLGTFGFRVGPSLDRERFELHAPTHVLGKFSDMLLAVETHPAMLLYLDNCSIGPDSIAGVRRGKGLNENLAREILELHTLGVRTGYTQADVTNFAKVITGWSIVPPRQNPDHGGEFMFNQRMHEPGAQTVIGRSYPQQGFAQGRAVLEDIAHHPATAKHIATKLARHFIADNPLPALVARLTQRFIDTRGDLMQVRGRWLPRRNPGRRRGPSSRNPANGRLPLCARPALCRRTCAASSNAQNLLGEPLWRPPAPKGFSDDSAAWLDGMAERLDIANQIGRTVGNKGQEPGEMIEAALGPLASAETREAVQRAESRPQALALLLMAPEFQRR